jgi:hypothetical protein
MPSLRGQPMPREGAGPLPALLLDRSYAPVLEEAKRRNAPGLATLGKRWFRSRRAGGRRRTMHVRMSIVLAPG